MTAEKIENQTSQSIIDGAIAVMADAGLRNLTTKRVSEHADVSTASIHYFFKTKERLIQESFAYVMNRLWGQLCETRDQHSDPIDAIKAMLEVFLGEEFTGVDTVKIWPQLWHHASTNAETGKLFRDYNNKIIDLFATCLLNLGLTPETSRIMSYRLNALHRGLWIEMNVGKTISRLETKRVYASMIETIKAEIEGEVDE